MIPRSVAGAVEFYDPSRYCNAAPVRDNLLFGRIAYGIANAQETVSDVIKAALADSGLLDTVYRIGLEHQVGSHGRLLFPRQRSAVDLTRCLIKNPRVMILDDALRAFPGMEAKVILERLIKEFEMRILITALPGMDDLGECELKVTFDKGRVTQVEKRAETPTQAQKGKEARTAAAPQAQEEDEGTLRAQVAE